MHLLRVSLNRGVRDEVPLKKWMWGGCVYVVSPMTCNKWI